VAYFASDLEEVLLRQGIACDAMLRNGEIAGDGHKQVCSGKSPMEGT
jgi:hypothetical protein